MRFFKILQKIFDFFLNKAKKDKHLKSATTGKWTPDYLRTILSERTFSIHEAQSPKLDFRTKNFDYKLKSGDEFLSSCMEDGPPYMYLRALGANFRKDRFGVWNILIFRKINFNFEKKIQYFQHGFMPSFWLWKVLSYFYRLFAR